MRTDSKKTQNYNILVYALGFIILLFLNRFLIYYLSLEQYGDYKIFEALISILVPLTILGGRSGVNVFLPHYFQQQKTQRAQAFLIFFSCIAIIFGLVLVLVPLYLKPVLLTLSKTTPYSYHSAFGFLYIIPVIAIFSMLAQTINCTTYRNLASIANKILFPLTFLVVILIFATEDYSKSLNTVYLAYCIIYLSLTILLAATILILIKNHTRTKSKDYEIRTWLKSTLPLLINQFIVSAIIQVDLVILEIYAFHETTVGIFGALVTLTTSYWIIVGAQQFRFTPEISILIQNKKYNELQKKIKQYITSTMLYSTPIIILSILFPSHILHWFNPKLTNYLYPFWVLSISTWLFSPGSMQNTLLAISKHNKTSVFINLVALVLLCTAEIILVPRYQLWGAIIPIVASRFFISFFSTYYCRRYFGLRYF